MANDKQNIDSLVNRRYEHGFITDIEAETLPPGLDEDVIRALSARKNEPDFMLEWRLKAYRHWLTMKEPAWAHVEYPQIDFQDIHYYSAPKKKPELESLDQVDPELLKTFEKLGIKVDLLAGLPGLAQHGYRIPGLQSACFACGFK